MDLTNIVGFTGVPAFMYYSAMIIIAVFAAGWVLNGKLQHICQENNKELDDQMTKALKRIERLEEETLKVSTYQEGMRNVCSLISDVKQDMRDNFTSLSSRIDTLLLSSQKSV